MTNEEVQEAIESIGLLCLQQEGRLKATLTILDTLIGTISQDSPVLCEKLRLTLLDVAPLVRSELEGDAASTFDATIASVHKVLLHVQRR
jgi:hypothetical protein